MSNLFFRGKCIDSTHKYFKQWVYSNSLDQWLDGRVFLEDNFLGDMVEVDFYTLGQATGLSDKLGNKIFEGDIFKSSNNVQYVIFHEGEFMLQGTKPKKITSLKKYAHLIEVVGNIYDNPEMISGEKE